MSKTLNILFQSDDGYAKVGAVSICSLLENNPNLNVKIFYLAYQFSQDSLKLLNDVVSFCNSNENSTANLGKELPTVNENKNKRTIQIEIIDAQKYHDKLEELGVNAWGGRIVTWCKMLAFSDLKLAGSLEEGGDRVLYLNPHSLVQGDISGFLDYDFSSLESQDQVMACVYDYSSFIHAKKDLLFADKPYFNCGLMLINHNVWKSEGLGDLVLKTLLKQPVWPVVDQGFCNNLFRGRIGELSFNEWVFDLFYASPTPRAFLKVFKLLNYKFYYDLNEVQDGLKQPKILYNTFRGAGQPWETGNLSPIRDKWKVYVDKVTDITSSSRINLKWPKAKKTPIYKLWKWLPCRKWMFILHARIFTG
jgi:lipopolysaccharide biosynthesis glycosyltransferase